MKKVETNMGRFTIEEKRRDLFGEELERWFKYKGVYGFYKLASKKVGRAKVERAFDISVKENDNNWKHFTQRVWNG